MADQASNSIRSLENAAAKQIRNLQAAPPWVWVALAGGAVLIAGIVAIVIAMQYSHRSSHA